MDDAKAIVSTAPKKWRWYVYELIDPRCGSAFYVGKGKLNRLNQHVFEARSGKHSRKCHRIRDIEGDGFSVLALEVARFCDEAQAYEYEALRIAEYGLENLTNVIPGGSGAYERYRRALRTAKKRSITSEQLVIVAAKQLARVLRLRLDGKRVYSLGKEWVVPASDMALALRDRVGATFFDKHVLGVG